MKHSGLVLLAVLALVGIIFAGCHYGPKRITYNALAGVEITVDHAMEAWGDYVAANHPTVSQEEAVQNAYARYQLAEEEAVDAARLTIALTSSGNTNGIPDAQSQETAARARAADALGDLLKILRAFGVKI